MIENIDPTLRVSSLEAAHKPPITVKPDAKVREATTLMINYDFSQLPVMQNSRNVKGMISWKTLGEQSHVHKGECRFVRDCMIEEVAILKHNDLLREAIKIIADNDAVLVENSAKEICGLVTTYDIASQYYSLAEPFLLLGEIENNIRQLIARAGHPLTILQSVKDPRDTKRKVQGVSDLTFGEYIRLLQEPDNWKSIGYDLSRRPFLADLDLINKIRNEVMHFRPSGLVDEQLYSLRRVARMLRSLKLWNKPLSTSTQTEAPEAIEVELARPHLISGSSKLRIAQMIELGRVNSGDRLIIAGKVDSAAEVIDAKNVRLSNGKIMTWNEYGQHFTGHVAVNIYRHVIVNGVPLESLR
jgi:predicted transcriptional regulator